ncbi:MAG: DUF3871 family protein [Saprospiraceae bacterium]|nr:DUF3871 family protein [Candidatus Vicinibacter affinis]
MESYNLLTEANKSSYIDRFLDREKCCRSVMKLTWFRE